MSQKPVFIGVFHLQSEFLKRDFTGTVTLTQYSSFFLWFWNMLIAVVKTIMRKIFLNSLKPIWAIRLQICKNEENTKKEWMETNYGLYLKFKSYSTSFTLCRKSSQAELKQISLIPLRKREQIFPATFSYKHAWLQIRMQCTISNLQTSNIMKH